MSETAPRRKYVRHDKLAAAIEKYHVEHPCRGSHRASQTGKRKDEIRHPVFSRTVIVEERNGSGVTVRTIERSRAFGKMRGSITSAAAKVQPTSIAWTPSTGGSTATSASGTSCGT